MKYRYTSNLVKNSSYKATLLKLDKFIVTTRVDNYCKNSCLL